MNEQHRPLPNDTIAAISTAPGRAGIAVLRVSGPDAESIAERLGVRGLEPRHALLAPVHHPEDGRLLDRALVTLHQGPGSYTGEDVLEISGHGGFLGPQLLLDAACAAGARLADPGEFTRRAFLNGRIDLVQAEATLDLIDARSPAAHDAALFQLERGLSRRIDELRTGVVELQAMLAYDIDFPEEDDGPIPVARIEEAGKVIVEALAGLLEHAAEGELVREGALTVIAGRPNAGKSSLFNHLLGQERAIVTELPGTTRDAIEALISVEGYPFRLVDTAGLHGSPGRVEGLGIEVAERYLGKADLVLFCVEAGRPLEEEESAFLDRWKAADSPAASPSAPAVVVVRTKADLSPNSADGLHVSATNGTGIDMLRRAMLEGVYAGVLRSGEMPFVTRQRQRRTLRNAQQHMQLFVTAIDTGLSSEVASTHLLDAQQALEELIGAVDTEEVLDLVFASFCVGK
jgi:tRNA modification GTPase